ncbi:MAG: aldo/keto reductase family protein [Actinomycetes bacterium]
MRYRKLGSSDLEVSEISLGSWLTYSGGVGLEQTRACTEAAFDTGINFFDTANVYCRGAAESAWGEILSGRPRESYILATMVWGQMSDDPDDRGLSAAQIAKQIDASLERLRTDYVDLYQAHRFDPDVPIEETIAALQQVVADGKARYLGFSEWTTEQIQAAIGIAGPDLFVSSQPQYSMLWQAPEAELFPLCAANGISQIVWSPLAQGVLTGKYRPGQAPPSDSRAANSDMNVAMDRLLNDAVLEAVDRLRPIADQAGLSMAELALAWVLRRPELASAIIGATRPEQVHANARASGMQLTPDTLAAIEEALGDLPVREPTLAPLARSGVTHREAGTP